MFYEQNLLSDNRNDNNGSNRNNPLTPTPRSRPQTRASNGRKNRCSKKDIFTSLSETPLANYACTSTREYDKRFNARRRDSRMNSADIYVARVTKNGMGCAKPCWRCLEWARWAGVKRIFHWDEEYGRFEVVKVNLVQVEPYGTRSDVRLFAGLSL